MKKIFTCIFCFVVFGVYSFAQVTWTSGTNIASSTYGNMHPRIALDASGNPLVVWNGSMNVYFSKWNGAAFTMPVQLNTAPVQVAGASWMGPDIAAKGDTVYVVYKVMPESDTSSHIFLCRSFDGGMNFDPAVQVDNIGDSISRFPTVTIDKNGHPIVGFMKFDNTFMDSRWVITRSNNFGSTFTTDVKASGWNGSPAVCDCCPGAVTCSGDTILMLYRDNNFNIRDMWAGVSTDNGASVSSGLSYDQNNWQVFSCSASGPDGVIVGDSLYATYMSGANGNTRVYYSAASLSAMNGAIGNELTGSFGGLGLQNYPRIATDGSVIGVAWKQIVNGTDQAVLLLRSIDAAFPTSFDTIDVGNVVDVDIAMKDGNVFVVWEDNGSGTVKFRTGSYELTTAISTASQPEIFVYPTVTENFIHIKGVGSKVRYNVEDTSGRIVMTASNCTDIAIQSLTPGMYILKVFSENKLFTQKIIKY